MTQEDVELLVSLLKEADENTDEINWIIIDSMYALK